MKFAAKLLLATLFIPAFLLAVLLGTVKYKFLNINSWKTMYAKYDVYQSIATVLKNNLEDKITSSGGNVSDVKVIIDLITPGNLKDFIDKNTVNVLDYVNGRVSEWIVYVPIDKVPKNLLPENLLGIQDNMPIDVLMAKFDVGPANFNYKQISQIGRSVNLLFFGSLFILIVITGFLIFLTEPGKRFSVFGTVYLISGLLTLAFYRLGIFANSGVVTGLSQTTTVGDMVTRILVPPMIQEAFRIWFDIGIAASVLGILFLFIKRPRLKL
jgi:hypothetical protein